MKVETKSHTVRSPLHHDGALYNEGDTVELTVAQAKALVALGVVLAELSDVDGDGSDTMQGDPGQVPDGADGGKKSKKDASAS